MWPTVIVMRHPCLQGVPEMSFVEHDQPIQTISTDCADQSLTKRVRVRDAHRRPENRQTHCRHRRIDALGIDAVAVMDDPSMRRVPTSKTTKTYTTRNVAVTATKKSHANTALA